MWKAIRGGSAAAPGKKVNDSEDDDVKLAMEMALAATQNPNLSAEEIRKLVGEKNKQKEILDLYPKIKEIRVKEEEVTKKRRENEEAQKYWEEQTAWFTSTVAQTAEQLKFEAEKQIYADVIKRDPEIIATRKQMKVLRKTIKAHRLQGNREDTRHAFKRQKQEKVLVQLNSRLNKQQRTLLGPGYQVQEYAKAMMRASKKWKKKGSDEELSLESQLCQNMHQMLTIEKQKSKLKKTSKEMKKYLQRCKSWLNDKKAFCEMHLITLEATANSMKLVYEEALARQDELIQKLKNSDEFRDVDLSDVDVSRFDLTEEEKAYDPKATLNALRGLPILDSIRHLKGDGVGQKKSEGAIDSTAEDQEEKGQAPELYVETHSDDEVSENSNLSDPDENAEEAAAVIAADDAVESLAESSADFGPDAPWLNQPVSPGSSTNTGGDGTPSSRGKKIVGEAIVAKVEHDFSAPLGLSAVPEDGAATPATVSTSSKDPQQDDAKPMATGKEESDGGIVTATSSQGVAIAPSEVRGDGIDSSMPSLENKEQSENISNAEKEEDK